MKTALTIIGSFILFLVSFGALFKHMHWPGSGILIVIGASMISFPYLIILLVYNLSQENTGLIKASQVVGFLAGAAVSIGIMFKVQHWPGGHLMFMIGMMALFYFYVPILLFAMFKHKGVFPRLNPITIITVFIFGALSLSMGATKASSDVNQSLINIYNYDANAISASIQSNKYLYDQLEKRLNAEPDSFKTRYDQLKKLIAANIDLCTYVDNIKVMLISNTEQYNKGVTADFNVWDLRYPENYDVPSFLLVGEHSDAPKGASVQLREMVIDYERHVRQILKIKGGNSMFYLEDMQQTNGELHSWMSKMFYRSTLISSLNILNSIKAEACSLETLCLLSILSNH